MTNLAKLIRLHMAANNLDNKQMAEVLDISPITLSRFLGGKNVEVAPLMNLFNWLVKEVS